MSAKRTERLLNLTICLLAARRFLTKDQIRQAVPDYARCATEEAFERMFERDKDELRELGIPLTTGTQDAFFGDELGYRIDRDAYSLPEVSFSPEELAVLGLAARAWQQASLSHAAGTAVLKLWATGVDPDPEAVLGLEPRVGATATFFADLWAAVRDRYPVSFDYRGPRDPAPARRRVEPWGLLSRGGRWYLVAADLDRAAARVFRVDRVGGPVTPEGPAGSVTVPPGTDLREHLARLSPPEPRALATLRVRADAGFGLRRDAVTSRRCDDEWDVLEVPYGDTEQLAAELVAYGPAVVVEGPEDLRAAVVGLLQALVDRPAGVGT